MAGKDKVVFVCEECGNASPRWLGKCPGCGCWNTLIEQMSYEEKSSKKAVDQMVTLKTKLAKLSELDADNDMRSDTGLTELNRVLGGGMVDGSVVLLTGDPGIGKSTLLLQMCKTLCGDKTILYVAGEESPRQIKLRASRLGIDGDSMIIAPETDMEQVMAAIEHTNPDIIMIDSIQTMNHPLIGSQSGSVSQIRECTGLLIHAAKNREVPVFIVGHINKDGGIAGPKVLEHMVDVVLYFEGDKHSTYRILRAVKNRFGSTNEIGVFEMGEQGLIDVDNPSLMLLSGRPQNVSGTCVACVMEGTRPILAEAQALVAKTGFGTPRRMSTGFDFNRAAVLIAVLEKRGGYFFGNLDAYINIIGGLRLDEPAADLPVMMALVSNLLDKPIPEDVAAFGEVGLTGELRAVQNARARVSECIRLGFNRILLPRPSLQHLGEAPSGVELMPVGKIAEAFRLFR